jgi:hypothetical protein
MNSTGIHFKLGDIRSVIFDGEALFFGWITRRGYAIRVKNIGEGLGLRRRQ